MNLKGTILLTLSGLNWFSELLKPETYLEGFRRRYTGLGDQSMCPN